jgi:hypothetical protein
MAGKKVMGWKTEASFVYTLKNKSAMLNAGEVGISFRRIFCNRQLAIRFHWKSIVDQFCRIKANTQGFGVTFAPV